MRVDVALENAGRITSEGIFLFTRASEYRGDQFGCGRFLVLYGGPRRSSSWERSGIGTWNWRMHVRTMHRTGECWERKPCWAYTELYSTWVLVTWCCVFQPDGWKLHLSRCSKVNSMENTGDGNRTIFLTTEIRWFTFSHVAFSPPPRHLAFDQLCQVTPLHSFRCHVEISIEANFSNWHLSGICV